MTSMVLKCGVSNAFHNKALLKGSDKQAYGNSFLPQSISLDQLVAHITNGGAFTMGAFENERRIKTNFVSSQMVALDLDDNVSVQDCLADAFIAQHAAFIGATASSGTIGEDGTPVSKTRVLFVLDAPITSREQWERLQRALIWRFEALHPDSGCKDCTRLFYGSNNPDYHFNPDKQLTVATLEAIATDMDTQSDVAPTEERTQEDNHKVLIRNKTNRSNNRLMTSAQRYADVALDNMVSELSSMSEGGGRYGGRNNTLYRFAAAMGNMVASGMISRSDVENSLRSAAQAAGMDHREIATTLYRGIGDGESTPFDLSRFETKGKPERPEPIVLADEPKELRDTSQIFYDQLMALDIAFEHGERFGWYPQDELPISWVSAMLTLASARSSLPAVWVKMHIAMRNGSLKPFFTIKDVVNATGYSTRLVTQTLETLQEMTFIHFLEGVSLDTLLYPESEQKGRPSKVWVIETDHNVLRCSLQKMLENKSRVKTTHRAMSPFTPELAMQLDLDDSDYEQFTNREAVAMVEPMNAEADRAYRREMLGNGHEWKGWQTALYNNYAIPLDPTTFDNCKELRVQVALWWIEHVRDINSREDWERILGCANGTIDSVFEAANIKTIQQNEQLEFDAPSDVNGMKNLYIQTQRAYRGKIWKISYKIAGETGWIKSSEQSYQRQFVNNLGKVEKVFMILTTPSKQVLMDAAEIAALEAETKTPDNILEPDFTPEPATISKMETVESEPKPKRVAVVQNEHVYTTFPYAWIFRQVQLRLYMYTDYTMLNDGTILDANNQLVRRRSDLGDTVRWFNTIASDSQQRTTASYYGEDYSEADELKELQKIEAIYFFEKQYNERIAPMRVEQALLIAIVAYVKAGAFNQQVTLSVVEPQTENTVNPYAIDKPDYAKPSAKAIEQMITRFNETDTQKNRFARGA